MSALINAGEGIDIDIHLRREIRSKAIDKVAQRIRLNRTKLKGMQDTSTDYEELANSIQAGVLHQERHCQLQRGPVFSECVRHRLRTDL